MRPGRHGPLARLRTETIGRFDDLAVAIAGLGTLDGHRVRFYVRCIHSTDNTDISFFIAFRSLAPGYYWDGGGRIRSGTLIIR